MDAPDAGRQIDELVTHNPLFKMSDSEVPPRLVAMYHESRKKLLPGLVREAYLRAKTSFEQKSYPMAQSQLKDVLQILGDDDLAEDSSGTGDIKLFADGFLKLAEMEIANAQKDAADAAVTAAAANKPPPPPPPDPLYSVTDKDVTPQSKSAARYWNPRPGSQRMEFRASARARGQKGRRRVRVRGPGDRADLRSGPGRAAKQWTFNPPPKTASPSNTSC